MIGILLRTGTTGKLLERKMIIIHSEGISRSIVESYEEHRVSVNIEDRTVGIGAILFIAHELLDHRAIIMSDTKFGVDDARVLSLHLGDVDIVKIIVSVEEVLLHIVIIVDRVIELSLGSEVKLNETVETQILVEPSRHSDYITLRITLGFADTHQVFVAALALDAVEA